MSEQDQQRRPSPLESERGSTNIEDGVVSRIAGTAAGEVEGVHMGGRASRAAGGVLGGVTGTQSLSQGISVEFGRVEAAIEVKMAVEYGRNIVQLAKMVRDRITERVENLTGLRVVEMNVTIDDIIFPEEEGERRSGLSSRLREDRMQEMQTEEIEASSRGRNAAGTEPMDLGAARSEAMIQSGRRFGEEMIRAEDKPEEDETTELRLDDEETEPRRRRER
jgi:uncharacterized alkaline shock family protein YloU